MARILAVPCSLALSLVACGSDDSRVAVVPPGDDGGAAGGGGIFTGGPSASGSSKPECYRVAVECPNLDLTRTSDMGLTASPTGCDNNCPYARDGLCDDGGSGSKLKLCGLGTDREDCGSR